MENTKKKRYLVFAWAIAFVALLLFSLWTCVRWVIDGYEYRSEHPAYVYKAPEVAIEDVGNGLQKVTQVTNGYSFTVPTTWLVEKPDGLKTGFRILPPKDSPCDVLSVSTWSNPEHKTAMELLEEHTPIDFEYQVEPYGQDGKSLMLMSRSEDSQKMTKSVVTPDGKDGYFLVGVRAGDPLPSECEGLLFDTLKSLQHK